MDFQKIIRDCYREDPNISGKQIFEKLNITNPRSIKVFWRELNRVQVNMRGLYPGIRKNTNAHPKSRRRGNVYWIPPKEK